MPTFQIINAYEAMQRLMKETIQMVDTRDGQSYKDDHIEDAFHLNQGSVAQFMDEVEFNTPVFVICYHGNSSKGIAQYLCDQGYQDVYSVAGGMVNWRLIFPVEY